MTAFPQIRLSKSAILGFGALAAMVSAPAAPAQTVFDAQVPFSFSSPTLTSPRGIAVAPDGTVYIADPAVGVVKIVPTTGAVSGAARAAASLAATATKLAPSVTIAKPTALTLDSTGALYIADGTDHVVIKMASPETSSAATTITYPGTEIPTALAVDSSNNLYIADETQDAIYKDVGGTATKLNLSSAVLKPVGLAVDSSGNVYFADAHNNEVYKYTASSSSAAVYLTTSSAGAFHFSSTTAYPIGMGFDPAASLYILDNDTGNLIQVVSPSTSTTNIQLPLSGLTPSGMTVSSIGNLYVSDDAANTADEVYYNNNPFNFGSVAAGTNSPAVTVNFQFVTREHGVAIYQSMQGDIATEFHTQSGTCGGTTGECSMAFYVDYSSTLPGTRNGAVGLTDNNGEILAAPNTGTDLAAALALYPGTQSTLSQTTQTLYEPQGLAVTGDGGTLFVADEGGVISGTSQTFPHPAVWEYAATAGTPGGTPTSIGSFTTPDAVALDATGDLFVADYSGSVTEIPVSYSTTSGNNTWPGFGTKLSLTGTVALNHPMALAFDSSGNLYIGDMGPSGTAATSSSPGYIIKVPANGGPATRLNYTVGGVPIVFPQALAIDSQGNLYIADGGDGVTDLGGVDVVSVATGAASAISFGAFGQLSQPSGLGFDAANDLYVLDGYNQRVLVVPVTYTGTVPSFDTGDISLLGQGLSGLTSALVTPTTMAIWQGGQYITFADMGYQPASGPSSPVQVLTLQSVNTSVDASSGSVSVTGVDVGNEEITFLAPSKTGSVSGGAAFSYSGCGSAGNTLEPGIVPNCTNTITYNGSGTTTQTATFTLNGNAGLDGSALGNKILVSGSPEIPLGVWSGGGLQGSIFGTVTLTNTGLLPLNLSAVSISSSIGGAFISGGSCTPITSLPQNGTCTVTFTFTNTFIDDATISVTDNSGGVVGTIQSVNVSYFLGIGGLAVSAGGTGGLFGANPLILPTVNDIPRNLLNANTSNATNNSTNKKGKKKLRR